MNNKNVIVAVAVILITAIFVGGIASYVTNPYHYEADITYDEEGIEYTLTTSNNSVYDVIALDSGGFPPVHEVIICCDDDRYFKEIKIELEVREFHNVHMISPERLTEVMTEPEGKAILIPRGLFPEEIYNGNFSDPMMEWFNGGGSVYWFGYMPVDGYSVDNYLQPMGLSEEDIDVGEDFTGTASGPLCNILGLRNSLTYNGLKADAGTPLAYVSDSGYSSITAKKVLNGSLIVFGGGHTYDNSMDVAQVIASGYNADTTLVGHWTGTVKGKLTKFVEFDENTTIMLENTYVYAYIGGYYIVYGERF